MNVLKSKVREYLARRLRLPEVPIALERLAIQGFQPNQIFDVGAYQGEFAQLCLRIWPKVSITCFEPLAHKVQQLQAIASHLPAIQVVPGLLGASPAQNIPIHEMETASSILEEQLEQNAKISFHTMRTVDQVASESGVIPDLLKLDVQGYELEVLRGAEQTLSHMQAILAEVNFLDIHRGVPLSAEIIRWLDDRDWVAFDICGLTRRPLDQALWQADLLFVQRNSSLRKDKRWSG